MITPHPHEPEELPVDRAEAVAVIVTVSALLMAGGMLYLVKLFL